VTFAHVPVILRHCLAVLTAAEYLWMQSVLEGISRDAGFKSEVLKAQDMHHTTLNRESERLANDVSKVRAEIRCQSRAAPCIELSSLLRSSRA
jgi:hypothetical protein